MSLSDASARNAKPQLKPYKLADTEGMYLLVNPSGSKYWRLKYRFGGLEKNFAIGVYPTVPLKDARILRDEAKKKIRSGIDPTASRIAEKRKLALNIANNFESVAREWLANQEGRWTEKHRAATLKRLERNLFPALGSRPISAITPPELLAVLKKIEERDAIDLAHRGQQTSGQIFRYAVATGRADRDITADIRGALRTRKKIHHAYLSEAELPEFLTKLETYDGDLRTKIAVKLLLLTFVRTSELRGARWEELDLTKAEWRIPAERMKMREPHIVPISPQAHELFREMQRMTGNYDFVFPNRNKPTQGMSENTMLYALYRMGYHSRTTAHGFRATASTILHEQGFSSEVIERQLAHAKRNKVRASYDHSQLLTQRRNLMHWWGNFIDSRSYDRTQQAHCRT